METITSELQKKCKQLHFEDRIVDGNRRISIYYKEVEASYIDLGEPSQGEIKIEFSFTDASFLQRRFNTCLRLVAGMIAANEHCILTSDAESCYSLQAMLNVFDCEIKPKSAKKFKKVALQSHECHEWMKGKGVIQIKTSFLDFDTCYRDLIMNIEKINVTGLVGGRTKRTFQVQRGYRARTFQVQRDYRARTFQVQRDYRARTFQVHRGYRVRTLSRRSK